jgi:ATP-binding protein involved in chromosome partitioning
MAEPDVETLRDILRGIAAPGSPQDIVAAGLVESIQAKGSLVQVTLLTDRARAREMEAVGRQVESLLSRERGVSNVATVLTAHRGGMAATPAAGPNGAVARPPGGAAGATPAAGGHAHGPGGHSHGPAKAGPAQGPGAKTALLPEVRSIVAVASGKGGVGKSTTAVNLAVALARQGLRVGLLDADIYGPSLPRMLGQNRKPEIVADRMQPIEAWGLKAMSIGFLVDETTAMIWRGPMVMGALEQMMGQVDWGALDILVVDMPPGTGDAQLTMAQKVAITGAVIVSTPQDIALIDARRAVSMFEKTRVSVLGIVENMSFFCCPACGARTEIFGHGGARQEARTHGVEFLGEVPLLLEIRTNADAGTPVVTQAPDSDAGRAYTALAARVWEKTQGRLREIESAAPRIVVQ